MCGEGDPKYSNLLTILTLFPPPSPPPSLSIIIDPRVNTTFQYNLVDCAAVVGVCTYRYYVLLRAGDMYALILDQVEEGKYMYYSHCTHVTL